MSPEDPKAEAWLRLHLLDSAVRVRRKPPQMISTGAAGAVCIEALLWILTSESRVSFTGHGITSFLLRFPSSASPCRNHSYLGCRPSLVHTRATVCTKRAKEPESRGRNPCCGRVSRPPGGRSPPSQCRLRGGESHTGTVSKDTAHYQCSPNSHAQSIKCG